MDNELSSDDRRRVEEFIQKNPDLKEELDILFQYTMTPDTNIVFKDKEELMKPAGASLAIHLANYEEWMVMYLDGELNSEQQKEVEQFIQQHPQVKEDFAILQKTKLQPETIAFPGKESLYRRTEKVKIITFNWRRLAVAAVLLIAISTTALLVFNKKSTEPGKGVAKNPGNEQKQNLADPVTAEKEKTPAINAPVIANTVAIAPGNKNQTITAATTKKNPVASGKNQPVIAPVLIKKEEPIFVDNNQRPSNNLPQPLNPARLNEDASSKAIANTNIPKEINTPRESLTIAPVTNPVAKTSANSNPDVIFASLEEGSKNKKSRGFFRKIARTFQKNTNTADEDRLLVGGLSIKLK